MINSNIIKNGFFSKFTKNNINSKEQLHQKLALLEIKNFAQNLSDTPKNTNSTKNNNSLNKKTFILNNKNNLNSTVPSLTVNNKNKTVNVIKLTTQIQEFNQNSYTLSYLQDLFLNLNNIIVNSNPTGEKIQTKDQVFLKKTSINPSIKCEEKQLNIIRIKNYLNLIIKFNSKIANSQFRYYQFFKNLNNLYKNPFNYAAKILNIIFLGMGCLISKPVFKIVYLNKKAAILKKELLFNSYKSNNNSMDSFQEKNPTSSTNIDGTALKTKNNNPEIIELLNQTTPTSDKKILINLFYYVRKRRIINKRRKYQNYSLNNNMDINILQEYILNKSNSLISDYVTIYNQKFNLNNKIVSSIPLKYKNTIMGRYEDKFKFLAHLLGRLFNCEIQLNLIRVYKPFCDSNILAKNLAIESFKKRFMVLALRLLNKFNLNDYQPDYLPFFNDSKIHKSKLIGINLKLAGRGYKQRIIPRKTVSQIQRGTLSNTKVNLIQTSRFIGKSKRGTYSFTVKLGHVIY